MWYNPYITFSKNRLFNYIVGERGNGKTTGAIKYSIEQHLKDNSYEIVWLRRYKEERKRIIPGFFNSIIANDFFNDTTFKTKGNQGFINDKLFCHFSALSTDSRIKGITSPNIRLIVFDEFLIDKNSRYLPNEPELFLSYYDTIARPSDPKRKRVPVLFLANAMSLTNPYFLYFNMKFNEKGEFKNQNIYGEIMNSREFREYAKHTEFANLIKNTEYANHSMKNQFLLDNYEFICQKSSDSKNVCNFIFQGKTLGLWVDWKQGKAWLSYKHDPSLLNVYCLSHEDLTPNLLTAHYMKGTYGYGVLKNAFNTGSLYYENINIKNLFFKIIKLINL